MFIILPVGMNYRTERYPVVTLSLIGVNTLVYLVSLVFFFKTHGESELWILENLWLIPAQSFWWTYLTSLFVHAGFFHLFGNMIFLFLFGACVEDLIGRTRFLIFYLVGGIIAELAFIAFSPVHFMGNNPLGGASGAISACLGMYLLLRMEAEIDFKYWYFFLFFGGLGNGEFSVPAWLAISFWFVKDLFWLVLGYYFNSRGSGTAFGAHVGGLLGGLALIGIYHWLVPKPVPVADPIITPEEIVAASLAAQPLPAGEAPTIFLHDGTNQLGPFTLTDIQRRLRTGEIGPETEYWSEGMSDWQAVAELSDQPAG